MKAMPFLTRSRIPVLIIIFCYCAGVYIWCSEVIFGILCEDFVSQVRWLATGLFLTSLSVSTYIRAMFSKPSPVPSSYRIPPDIAKLLKWSSVGSGHDKELLEKFIIDRGLTIRNGGSGCIRLCKICRIVKPDRCHHCRQCKKCIMGFDHHCPMIGNCVHAMNRKLFILTCIYSHWLCWFGFFTSYQRCGAFYRGLLGFETLVMPNTNIMILISLQFLFGIGTCNLTALNMVLVVVGYTTVELYELRKTRKRKKGTTLFMANFEEVFGKNKWLWFVPVVGKDEANQKGIVSVV